MSTILPMPLTLLPDTGTRSQEISFGWPFLVSSEESQPSQTVVLIFQSEAATPLWFQPTIGTLASEYWMSNEELLASKRTWHDREFREAYAEAAVEQGIAWQVRVNRESRRKIWPSCWEQASQQSVA
jgi:hypothetical protein